MRGRLTNVLTPYEDMVLQRGMQKSVRWQVTKITPEIPSPFSFEVYQIRTTIHVHVEMTQAGYSMRSCYCGISLFKCGIPKFTDQMKTPKRLRTREQRTMHSLVKVMTRNSDSASLLTIVFSFDET
uniref:Uncharacterized protein n=1 Tax=Lactuca sativa TaxID=4236 RepID=A0A9R1UYU5_LACSA|nr:hypothetical protein LSAT_V11C700363700 [Lactuca sativa]